MAQTATLTYDDGEMGSGNLAGCIRKVILDWISHTDGTVTVTTRKISGFIIKAVTNPGAAAPSANYDIAITDEESVSIFSGAITANLDNRHTSTTEVLYYHMTDGSAAIATYPAVCDKLTIAITNAGDTKDGRLILYYRV